VVSFRRHAISTNCIRISKSQLAASTWFCKVWRSAVKLNEVLSVGRLIARRYLDGPEVLSLRFLNFTAESTSKLRRMRNSRLLPRVQSTNREVRRSIWRGVDNGREDIRRAHTWGGNWESVCRTAGTKRESASAVCARCSRHWNRIRVPPHPTMLNRARSVPNRTI
jgi:hypothetical protein